VKVAARRSVSDVSGVGEVMAEALLSFIDERFGPSGVTRKSAGFLKLASERVTLREIIRRRVEAEVHELNSEALKMASLPLVSRSLLVQPAQGSPERLLNPELGQRRKAKQFDPSSEADRAVAAFEDRRFIMLIDGRQIDDVDAPIGLTTESEVVFLYLSPLKGG